VLFFSDSTQTKIHAAYGDGLSGDAVASRGRGFGRPTTDTDRLFTVVIASRLVERKGVDEIVTAVADFKDVSLWIIDDGPRLKALEGDVRERESNDRVAFVGEIPHDRVIGCYHGAERSVCSRSTLRG
jgi:glycosyltransferase involved in cell wall biosynthesis